MIVRRSPVADQGSIPMSQERLNLAELKAKSPKDLLSMAEELEIENARLKKVVAELTLDKEILQEVAKGNF